MDTHMPKQALVAATNDDELIRVLGNSLYPGARPESIRLVLAWCRATNRDPMKKPIHIVPMKVKDQATNRWEWRDVLMPGIGTYRSDAAATGEYAGLDEAVYGPDVRADVDGCELTYPAWCTVTVKRLVGGQERSFSSGKEFWLENYASGEGGKGVNYMWRKRPYAQLAKVAEAQALRKAFPDETGQTNTTDEMEGKTVFEGHTIDAEPDKKTPAADTKTEQYRPAATKVYDTDPATGETGKAMDATFIERAAISLVEEKNATAWLKVLDAVFAQAPTVDDIAAIRGFETVKAARANAPTLIKGRIEDMIAAAIVRLSPKPAAPQQEPEQGTGGPAWDATNGNGTHDLAGQGTNVTQATGDAATGAAVREEVEKVAGDLAAEKPEGEEDDAEWMPGDP